MQTCKSHAACIQDTHSRGVCHFVEGQDADDSNLTSNGLGAIESKGIHTNQWQLAF